MCAYVCMRVGTHMPQCMLGSQNKTFRSWLLSSTFLGSEPLISVTMLLFQAGRPMSFWPIILCPPLTFCEMYWNYSYKPPYLTFYVQPQEANSGYRLIWKIF